MAAFQINDFPEVSQVLVAANITMQFGAKPLFENVLVKFGEGFRYGLIGANGSGKSTFMKIIAGELEASAGNISKDSHERMAYLRQDQFAFEDQRVIDVVMMGHEDMWACMQEKDAIYADPEATEEQYLHAAELESKFAEFGGYPAEALAMLETVAYDPRSYNALGNACYVNGDIARALDYLQRAVQAGDEAAARNLFLIKRRIGDGAE